MAGVTECLTLQSLRCLIFHSIPNKVRTGPRIERRAESWEENQQGVK